MAANEIILRRTLKEELIAERQAPMGGRRERAGGNLGFSGFQGVRVLGFRGLGFRVLGF